MQCLSSIPELTDKYIPMRDRVIPNMNVSADTSEVTMNSKRTRSTTMSKAKLSNDFKGKDM